VADADKASGVDPIDKFLLQLHKPTSISPVGFFLGKIKPRQVDKIGQGDLDSHSMKIALTITLSLALGAAATGLILHKTLKDQHQEAQQQLDKKHDTALEQEQEKAADLLQSEKQQAAALLEQQQKAAEQLQAKMQAMQERMTGDIQKLSLAQEKLTQQLELSRQMQAKAEAQASAGRIDVKKDPAGVIDSLTRLYGSNERMAQRRRIYLTESLVDIGPGSLPAIREFLRQDMDAEPDVGADSHRRMLDRYGITQTQYVAIQKNISETLKQMKPALDADKKRRDAERAKRTEEDAKRMDDFRGKMEAFRATLEGLPEEERREKMGEWFREQRNNTESVARREQEEKDREAPGTTEVDKLRTAVEANVKVVLGADQFEAMQNDRSLGRLISEIGGNDYRAAVGGGGRGDWGRGRGGATDRGRGRGTAPDPVDPRGGR